LVLDQVMVGIWSAAHRAANPTMDVQAVMTRCVESSAAAAGWRPFHAGAHVTPRTLLLIWFGISHLLERRALCAPLVKHLQEWMG